MNEKKIPSFKDRIALLNTPIDRLSMASTVGIIDRCISEKKHIKHVVVNAAKLVYMQANKELFNSVVSSDIINADGQGVVLAARFLGNPLPERVAGIDLMEKLIELSNRRNYKIFFLGAKEFVVQKVVSIYGSKYSKDIVAGYRNGYFSQLEEETVAKQISLSNADILFVGISSPKKEIFLNKYCNVLKVPFIMGVGGSFDVVAGLTKRAPLWMQKLSLEWLYRFFQEPRRMWKRYLKTNSLFIFYVLKEKLRKKVFF
jgi:N-acetylglucosaminyldiphosphoundecaprenol N-acetyl-beta-D-mannosaminyltransferase